MLFNKYILLFAFLLGSFSLSAQGSKEDTVILRGVWKLVRLEVKTFGERDELLNTVSIDKIEGRIEVNSFVPVFLLFNNDRYTMNGQLEREVGVFQLFKGKMLCIPLKDDKPETRSTAAGKFCLYELPDEGSLSLEMPEVYYYDNKQNRSVKEIAVCYYQKSNDKVNGQ